jgi:hypothetical protein
MLGWRGYRGDCNFLERGGGTLCGATGSGFLVLANTVLILVVAFFFVFLGGSLAAAVDFDSGFLGPSFFLFGVTLGCLGASVTGAGFGLGSGVVFALTTHPLGRRFTPRPGPSAQ